MESRVETADGWIEGRSRPGYWVWKGIPFAKPPIGALRFLPPQPSEPWTGVRSAHAYGSAALQRPSGVPFMDAGVPLDEDCLYLNVFTPATSGARPVLLWIHGGGFNLGSGSQAMYEGGALVQRGDVVLVTMNYRLGLLGYLHLGDHEGDAWGASSNLGQLDQIAALRWIRDNIARFGGDPNNVTIFGESAGAVAVAALLAMPEAKGMFHRALGQSGTANLLMRRESAAVFTAALLAHLGVTAANTRALQALAPGELFRAEREVIERIGRDPEHRGRLGFWPIIDGKTIPIAPLEAVRGGAARGVPLLFGSNRDEDKLAAALAARPTPEIDAETLLRRVRRALGQHEAHAEALVAVYRRSRSERDLPAGNRDLLSAILTDQRQRLPALRLLAAQRAHDPRTYCYLFCWEHAALRASIHALEVPFVFGKVNLDRDAAGRDPLMAAEGPEAQRLSEQMIDAWSAFARSGDPSCPGLAWDAHDDARRATMIWDRRSEVALAPFEDERAAWDALA
jgi:para-nitrobenzyl esterase